MLTGPGTQAQAQADIGGAVGAKREIFDPFVVLSASVLDLFCLRR